MNTQAYLNMLYELNQETSRSLPDSNRGANQHNATESDATPADNKKSVLN